MLPERLWLCIWCWSVIPKMHRACLRRCFGCAVRPPQAIRRSRIFAPGWEMLPVTAATPDGQHELMGMAGETSWLEGDRHPAARDMAERAGVMWGKRIDMAKLVEAFVLIGKQEPALQAAPP